MKHLKNEYECKIKINTYTYTYNTLDMCNSLHKHMRTFVRLEDICALRTFVRSGHLCSNLQFAVFTLENSSQIDVYE